jgi:hypothetical protein
VTSSAVHTVAERLLDPITVIAVVPEPAAASLSHGLAGTALLHARLSTLDDTFAQAAERHWTAAAQHLKKHPVSFSGIHGGQGALAASLIIGTAYLPNRDQHRDLVARSAAWLSTRAGDLARQYHNNAIPSWHVYDTITGLAGIGRVLLAAHRSGHDHVQPGLTAALTTLTAILTPAEGPRPGWHLPAAAHPPAVKVHPSGAADTGLAHGVAGPLALLATAADAGWSVPGQAEAIRHAAAWLLHWRRADGRWPPHVTGDELDHHTPPTATGRRDAWCYGTPGIARALTLAGQALHDHNLITAAHDALASLAARATSDWDVDGPTLCHGHAGVLQSAPGASRLASSAAEAIADYFDPATRFGFQHHEHNQRHDNPGLLTGAAGIALTLADSRG